MSKFTAKFVSALFASILAGANFAAVAQNAAKPVAENAAKPADTCLSGPKGAVPAGSHWYYRVERGTKRNCWYLGEEKDKTARAAPQDSASPSSAAAAAAPAPDPAPPQPTARKSIADAHAELPSPQARVEPDVSINSQPQANVAAAPAAIANSQTTVAPDAGPPPSLVTSRWPDGSAASPPDNTRVAEAEPPARPQAITKAAAQPAAPMALAAADSVPERPSGSIQMLLMVMAGALALAGLTASMIFRFGHAPAVQPEIGGRRAIWDSVPVDRSPVMFSDEDIPVRRERISLDPRPADDPDRRVREMLARLARSAAN